MNPFDLEHRFERHPGVSSLLSFFEFDHLPENLQLVSKDFHDLAHRLADGLEQNTHHPAELTAALRKLLEAKDCAVRAAL